MTFALTETPIPLRSDIATVFGQEEHRLARAGATFTGAEHVAMAVEMRRVRRRPAAEPELVGPVGDAVRTVAVAPETIDRSYVEALTANGVTAAGYVEVVGLVSRLAAIDTFHRGLGMDPPPLPEPVPAEPTGTVDPLAVDGRPFVPTVRGASVIWALSLVPDEAAAMMDFHHVLYLSPDQMQQDGSPRALTRPQLELVGARTSVINECFY